ncbi:MAG: GNAT family N-acetyltransferase [bacterium]|nr:GNAT family N-acetyltransferase [bacterium]
MTEYPRLTRHEDLEADRPLIEESMARYGWAPEHNTANFFHSRDSEMKGAFFVAPEGWGALVYTHEEEWHFFAEPMAPPLARAPMLRAVCDEALRSPRVEKVVMEATGETRKTLLKLLGPDLRSRRIAETFRWPVLDLAKHDPAYPGSRFKDLRNAKSRLGREHRVEVVSAQEILPAALHDLVRRWEQNRRATHQSIPEAYHALIDDDFSGAIRPRVIVVDGKPESLSAGWRIHNSNTYYLAVSLHSYAHKGLGETAMMLDIDWAKSEGFAAVDLGGSDAKLLAFKKQFGDIQFYKTHQFSIVRK